MKMLLRVLLGKFLVSAVSFDMRGYSSFHSLRNLRQVGWKVERILQQNCEIPSQSQTLKCSSEFGIQDSVETAGVNKQY
jgi:glycyl-tRNA synthetase alpha subunit